MLLLQELACGSCLNVVSEAKEESSAAPPVDRAPQGARSAAQGHGLGVAFLWFLALCEQRKGLHCRGQSRPRTSREEQKVFSNRSAYSTAACPHRLAGPAPPSPASGRGSKKQPAAEQAMQVWSRSWLCQAAGCVPLRGKAHQRLRGSHSLRARVAPIPATPTPTQAQL